MKKILCFILVLMTGVCIFTSCNFTSNLSGAAAGTAESTPLVKEMMTFLAEENAANAKLLLHPKAPKNASEGLEQMEEYLDGRTCDIEMISINVQTSTGTAGKVRQEQVGYKVTLNDGQTVYLNTIYLKDNDNAGFISFQMILGVI